MVKTTTRGRSHTQSGRSDSPKNTVVIRPRGLDGTHHVLAPMYECNTIKEELTRYLVARAILRPNFAYDFRLV
ncbi:hypothetical protein GOBAR_AA11740 [Gossypium barbadense]|uniref:Uncharacterized protein n=1 Tax=Gossypium barbadense TaxID=3634 RepID=A0A2P5Y031_GOSBA|nr:hypothetical protein GOBAR_AA11740 [Gossypium barbadense]